MIIVLLGPQGSGKGTQAEFLEKRFNLDFFSMGEFLRKISDEHRTVKNIINKGKLVPDVVIMRLVEDYFRGKGKVNNIIFDGLPRTVGQYRLFEEWLEVNNTKIDIVLILKISDKEAVRRISARRMDPNTGEIYNLVTNPPPDGVDKESLVQRDDDKPESIEKRLQWYHSEVEPMVAELKKTTKVVEVDGERSIEEINKELEEIVGKIKSGKN